MPLDNPADMPSEQELSAKVAYAQGQLNAGGDNKYMRKWWMEYKEQKEALQKLRAAKEVALEDRGKTASGDVDSAPENPSHESANNGLKSTWEKLPSVLLPLITVCILPSFVTSVSAKIGEVSVIVLFEYILSMASSWYLLIAIR